MTIGGLIRILPTHLQYLPVVVNSYERGYEDMEADLVSRREIRLDTGEVWWEPNPCLPPPVGSNQVLPLTVSRREQESEAQPDSKQWVDWLTSPLPGRPGRD